MTVTTVLGPGFKLGPKSTCCEIFWQFKPAMNRPSVEKVQRPCFLNHRNPICGPMMWFSAAVSQ